MFNNRFSTEPNKSNKSQHGNYNMDSKSSDSKDYGNDAQQQNEQPEEQHEHQLNSNHHFSSRSEYLEFLPGGNAMLFCIIGVTIAVIIEKIASSFTV